MDKIRQLVGNLDNWLKHKKNCETRHYPFNPVACNCGLQDILFHIETEITREENKQLINQLKTNLFFKAQEKLVEQYSSENFLGKRYI